MISRNCDRDDSCISRDLSTGKLLIICEDIFFIFYKNTNTSMEVGEKKKTFKCFSTIFFFLNSDYTASYFHYFFLSIVRGVNLK